MTLFHGLTRSLGLAAVVAAGVLSSTGAARAQAVAAMVNGNPITAFDVDQRMRIGQIVTRKPTSRQQALQELVDDQIKIIEARRIGYRLNDENIDDQVARIAKSNGQSVPDFLANLSKAGIDGNAYRNKLKADYSWDLALQQKFKAETTASSGEVNAIVETKIRDGGAKVTDYELNSVIFVVARNDGNAGARERAANAARGSFHGCEAGLEMLRKLPDVAIRPAMKRSSDILSPQLLALLAKTPVGSLSQPFRSEQGIEMVAVCGKSERIDTSAVRTSAEKEIAAKKGAAFAETYLKSLRSKALVQYR